MKRLGCLILTALFVYGADARPLDFERASIEGIILSEDDAPREFKFAYTNNTDEPVVITRVGTSCGCTTVDYPRRPIEAGEKGEIAVTFDPRGMAGRMERTVWLYTSASSTEAAIRLTLAIEVTPSGDEWARDYKVRLGGGDGMLRAKSGSVSFGVVGAWQTGRVERIECVNVGDKPVTLSVMKGLAPKWLALTTEPATIEPGAVADIVVAVDGKKLNKAEKPGRVALSLVLDGLGGGRPSERMVYVFLEVGEK